MSIRKEGDESLSLLLLVRIVLREDEEDDVEVDGVVCFSLARPSSELVVGSSLPLLGDSSASASPPPLLCLCLCLRSISSAAAESSSSIFISTSTQIKD